MSTFTNTVDSVSDAVLTRSIVNKSITEFNDNISTVVEQYAFYGCTALANVNIPSVTVMKNYSFKNCSSLKKIDLTATTSIMAGSLTGCSQLETLILRNTNVVSLAAASVLSDTLIAGGTGYIYVPSVLVDSYKTTTGWADYANQIRAIEDYPEVCDPYSWAVVAKVIDNGTYKDVYKVGDTVPLDLGSEGLINMQIAAFDTDDLADGSGKAPITWIAKELLATSKRMNPTLVTNYDYPESPSWTESSSVVNQWSTNTQYCKNSVAKATWTITAVTDGILTVSYKVGTSNANYNKITVMVNDTAIATDDASATSFKTHDVNCAAGDTIIVTADYTLLEEKNYTGYIKFESTGEINVLADIENAPERVVNSYQEGTGVVGGWEKCELRAYLKETIKPLIPEVIRNRIVTVTKSHDACHAVTTTHITLTTFTQTTVDDVWLPSNKEIAYSSPTYGELFTTDVTRIKKRNGDASSMTWYLRNAYSAYVFGDVRANGSLGYGDVSEEKGICLCFCT